ncbi:UbiH/UbiF/VisC/COQ6 family ubiquinone biosynthesis hydroxylase [Kozakia baliensis]|uniref:Ubiquinone biosynthesis protein UbiH n=1 Tax=Kozakia baliensis TaxID=153496 RepID=A0A1D8UWD2_9PROT|nr:UbiH/UbiF/VisC/COQ6 family ubiquinone biosynthesis hydroxylase [Kozakia baliensis]AOX17968.1 ubiquinone biosynthesis protein UbiH [Kozakia baliensis]GBR26168.1 ubiquinone biosynthesis hydroxylase UbiH/UbiF/VisC/COQ6 [Kozakia baliensis NRIC 0488]GEL64427.1 2-octaprenyl-6-methoxyphenyl hydroxylase [Kozakia baliensis]
MKYAQDIDICINGAGPVGATLACRLAHVGLRVLVVDRAPLVGLEDPSLDGRAYAIAEGSRRMLESAGVWQHLPGPSQPIREITVTDGRPRQAPSPLSLKLGPDDAPRQDEGTVPFGWMVEARHLRAALNMSLRSADHDRLTVAAPDTAHFSFEPNAVVVRLESGTTYRAPLAIAAEGRRSPLREQAGILVTKLPYHQSGLITIIAHERPHDGRALEHFLPQGPFARLPLPGTQEHPYRSAIVWAETTSRAERFHALPDDAYAREIMARLGDDVGNATPIGRRWIYPLSAQYAQRYVAPRLALAGDSAHGLHPIAGQGLNVGFRDVIALSDLLEEAHRRGEDLGNPALLARYQRRVRPANMMAMAACDGLERLFGNDNPILRTVRDLGLGAMDRLPGLRRAFVRRAMGV